MRRVRVLAVAVLLLAPMCVLTPWARATAPVLPSQDPFYRYSGSKPLRHIAPGTVLNHRTVHLALEGHATPISAEQLLYRTTGQRGEPAVTVTTVLVPTPAVVVPHIVGYLSF